MSTFLELCQGVARESGTFSGLQPTSVANQSGRSLKVVNWTNEAWEIIQNLEASWKWLRTEFDLSNTVTIADTARYTPAAWNITDLAEWITEEREVTMYLSSTGVSDEGNLTYIDWVDFRFLYTRGTQNTDRPFHWSVSPANEFCLGPTPDAVFVVNGEYRQTGQVMEENDDVPSLPARFHDIIIWQGVIILGEHDEAPPDAVATALRKYAMYLAALKRDRLPRVHIAAEAIA